MIETWRGENIDELAEVLHACVHAGASVSFILPFSIRDAAKFWCDQVLPHLDTRCVLVARVDRKIAGTVQLDMDTPPNQPHRAEVKKLLVHPKARRLGIARSLMTAIEAAAADAGRTLLNLDTVTGGVAEHLYRSMGYAVVGQIPGYALNFNSNSIESTTVMYKQLRENPRLQRNAPGLTTRGW